MKKSVTAFVNKENYTLFICPYCEKNHRIFVAKYKAGKHTILYRCSCRKKFVIELNFRQFYRKKVNLIGEVINISSGSNRWYAMTVVDISMTGLRFKLIGPKEIKEGHRLRVRFTLDGQQDDRIDKDVRVISIGEDHYGCEFLNLAYEEKELGFYLFSG